MTTEYPTYPATTFEQAVSLAIFSSNQLHDVVNEDATTVIETENGYIPSLRKALVDNFYFKTPLVWAEGTSVSVFNQLYYFAAQDQSLSGLYYAPSATTTNPISMQGTPVGDANFVLYSAAASVKPAMFSSGLSISSYGRIYYSQQSSGIYASYAYIGNLPYEVTASTPEEDQAGVWTPINTTGIWLKLGEGNVLNIFSSEDADKGDALVTVKQPYAGAIARTQHDKNLEQLSVRDFGITGATGEDSKWVAMIEQVGSSPIVLPAGDYTIDSEIPADTLCLLCKGATFSGNGYLKLASIYGTDNKGNPFYDFGNTVGSQPKRWGKLLKVGDSDIGLSGLCVGGANPKFGSDGMTMYLDGYPGWGVLQPTKWVSSAELALMPSSRAGSCTFTAGSKVFTITGGADLREEDIGEIVWVRDSAYVVASVADRTFTTVDAASDTGTATYTCTYNYGVGKCSVSGKSLKVTYGDPITFVLPCPIVVNGVRNSIIGFTDSRNITLRDDMGTLTNVDYRWSSTVDNLASAFRLHRISGAGFEENLSIIAYNKGMYHIHAAGGGSSQYPIFMGSGWDSDGSARKSITIAGDGLVSIGGKYGTGCMEFGYREESTGSVNRFRVDSAPTGNTPSLSVVGVDANVDLNLRTKGAGNINLLSQTLVQGAVLPASDDTFTLGNTSSRWKLVYAAGGLIQTSDGNLKDVLDIETREYLVAKMLTSLLRKFRWKAGGTINFGVIAQDVEVAFAQHGLVATDYGVLTKDEDSHYGVNYQQLYAMMLLALATPN